MGWDGMCDDVLRGEILQLVSRFLNQGLHCASMSKVLLRKKNREMRWKSEVFFIDCFSAFSAPLPPRACVGSEDDNWIYIQTHRATFRRFLKDGRFYLDHCDWFLSYAPDSMADVRRLPLTSHFRLFIAPSADTRHFLIIFHSPLYSSLLYTGGGHYDERGGYGGGGGGNYGGGGGGGYGGY